MPNWCSNELCISADAATTEAIIDFLKESINRYRMRIKLMRKEKELHKWERDPESFTRRIFDFDTIIPYPEEFETRDNDSRSLSKEDFKKKYGNNADGFNSGGYEWCILNWGTKWDAQDVTYVPHRNTYYFDTAWGPAHPIIAALHKRFLEATLYYEYYEQGAGFMGGCSYKAEEDWDDEGDVSSEDTELIESALKQTGEPPKLVWEAGKPYNQWESDDYRGYKGG